LPTTQKSSSAKQTVVIANIIAPANNNDLMVSLPRFGQADKFAMAKKTLPPTMQCRELWLIHRRSKPIDQISRPSTFLAQGPSPVPALFRGAGLTSQCLPEGIERALVVNRYPA